LRAYDVRTGKELWRFHTIPRPGEFGNETWENNSGRRKRQHWRVGGTSRSMRNSASPTSRSEDAVVGFITAAMRPGSNLFAESLVAVDAEDRRTQVAFQFVHHPIWNWDMTSAPILADININGRPSRRSRSLQAGLALRVPIASNRPAGVADRREAGAAVRRAGREDLRRRSRFRRTRCSTPATILKVPEDLIDFTPELRQKAQEFLKRYKSSRHRRSRRACSAT